MTELQAMITLIGKMMSMIKCINRKEELVINLLCVEPEQNYLLLVLKKEFHNYWLKLDKEEGKELNSYNFAEVLLLGALELVTISNQFTMLTRP